MFLDLDCFCISPRSLLIYISLNPDTHLDTTLEENILPRKKPRSMNPKSINIVYNKVIRGSCFSPKESLGFIECEMEEEGSK